MSDKTLAAIKKREDAKKPVRAKPEPKAETKTEKAES